MAAPRRGQLLAVLGMTFGLAAIVGNTIGGGILRTPGDIAALLPTPFLFFGAWIVGALYAFGGANALSELATMTPKSGGQYHYARRALGDYAGFVVGWVDWLGTAGSATAVSLVLAESVTVLLPPLAGHEAGVGALVIVFFTLLLWRGVRESARMQTVTSAIKALAFVALIGAGVVYAVRNGIAPAVPVAPAAGGALLVAFIIAMQGVIYTYDGWNGMLYFTEEMPDPGRTVPRATFGGLIAVTLIYLAVNAAFVMVVPLGTLAGQPLAAGTVAQTMFGSTGDLVIRLVVIASLPSAVNAMLPMSSRVLYSMSRDRLAPAWASTVNAGGTPTRALLASAIVSLLFLLTGTATAVMAVMATFFVAVYAISLASVFVLRAREPAAPRPYRAWGHPWTTGIMFAGSVAFLGGAVYADPRNSLIAGALVVVSYPVFRLAGRFLGAPLPPS